MLSFVPMAFVVVCVSFTIDVQGAPSRHRGNVTTILRNLTEHYDDNAVSFVPPLSENYDQIEISVNWYPTRILSFNEHDELIEMRGLLTQRWNDPAFKWDPNETRITYVEMPVQKMWKPTLVLNESFSHDFASVFYENKLALVYYDGSVMWESAVKTSTFCQVLQRTFPFDRQACKLTFSFAANHHGELIFSHRNTTPRHTDSGGWEVTNVYVPYCPEKMEFTNHSAIRFVVDLKRTRQKYYIDTLVAPCFLLCVLTSLVVFVPAKSQQKIPLIITTVLALFVYQGLVDSIGPPTGNPLLGTFTLIVICAGIFATFTSIVSLRLAYLDDMLPCCMKVKAGEESIKRNGEHTQDQTAESEKLMQDDQQGDSQQEDRKESGSQGQGRIQEFRKGGVYRVVSLTQGEGFSLKPEKTPAKKNNSSSQGGVQPPNPPVSAPEGNHESNINESRHSLPCKCCKKLTEGYVFCGMKMITWDFLTGCIIVLFNVGCIIGFAIRFRPSMVENNTIAVNYCSDEYYVD